jgi:hypothetical protein
VDCGLDSVVGMVVELYSVVGLDSVVWLVACELDSVGLAGRLDSIGLVGGLGAG